MKFKKTSNNNWLEEYFWLSVSMVNFLHDSSGQLKLKTPKSFSLKGLQTWCTFSTHLFLPRIPTVPVTTDISAVLMSYIFSIPIHWSLLFESFSPVFWVDRLVDEPTGSLVLVLPVLSTVFTWISLSFWMDFVPEYSSYFVFCDCWRSC